MKSINYIKGFKYQLVNPFVMTLPELRGAPYASAGPYLSLDKAPESTTDSPVLVIQAGYAWDGASGPTLDTKSSMRAALVHDALYQLMRAGSLHQTYRKEADSIFYRLCREDGMGRIRAYIWYFMVRKFAATAAATKNKRQAEKAP